MPQMSKYPLGETDHELQDQKSSAGDGTRITLKVWQNYGRRHGKRLGNEQIFHRVPDRASRIDAEAVW
ncbi:uncharacterized protein Z519_00286 [Cladophialophora bantiana CBS 173.52]|uniref:Uncharacterized protein n=1 Tax=Cladophialophora bantiana (strain ATCC 10958 / CBS 173.52 / CDC B-1940 / NIH 8579) TaxID=1442370 RepID=A0A0D2I5U6_CLAB1|nr:uncharacterized protein Z519_00286 [Cladophialophora bantiana CBS 173.52]KIW98625.1 hypothetical protein Z519_00286 [Cladophialophora bantiana CBS 173.52]